MNPTNSNTPSAKEYVPFSACDQIAELYQKQGVSPTTQKEGLLGQKNYTWIFQNHEQYVEIDCVCRMSTFGMGWMSIDHGKNKPFTSLVFRKDSVIDHNKSEIKMKTIFLSDQIVKFPKPDFLKIDVSVTKK